MINRHLFRAFPRDPTEILERLSDVGECWDASLHDGSLLAASLFQWRNNLFLYYESPDPDLLPGHFMAALSRSLLDYPAQPRQPWVRMMDIFHYNEPQNDEHWRRTNDTVSSVARLNRLLPSMYSSYIFHHYQLQEERPGIGDQYGIIGVHDDLMLFYHEEPRTLEGALHKGRLDTNNCPHSEWPELMQKHFLPWEDTGEAWLTADKLIQAFPHTGVHVHDTPASK